MSPGVAPVPAGEPRVRVTAPTAGEWQDCAADLADLVEKYAPADHYDVSETLARIDALVWRADAAVGLRRSR